MRSTSFYVLIFLLIKILWDILICCKEYCICLFYQDFEIWVVVREFDFLKTSHTGLKWDRPLGVEKCFPCIIILKRLLHWSQITSTSVFLYLPFVLYMIWMWLLATVSLFWTTGPGLRHDLNFVFFFFCITLPRARW